MEIARQKSSKGTTYRIIAWSACNHTFFEIEYLKYPDVDTNWWELANGVVYKSLAECKDIFNALTK